jgi:hypothetical protein
MVIRPEAATVTVKIRPLAGSVTVYVAAVVALPRFPKIALALELRLMLSGSGMLPEAVTSPATLMMVPPQLVCLNCIVVVV